MGLDNLFYFNIDVHLSSTMVIGSLSYYSIWMLVHST
jgi:hypothetical protein